MANARTTTTVIGAAVFAFGALLAFFAIVYAPLTSAWWIYNFHAVYGGIAALICGIVIVLSAQTLMQEVKPYEERKRMEIPT